MATLGQQAVGTVVKIKENNVPQEWIVMHHGDMPAFGTSLEASSGAAGGTWLLRKNIVSQGAICEYTTGVDGKKTYENSPADTYLTNTFLPTISSEIRNQILTVSIEISYLFNERTYDTTISRKAFLPDLNELENTWGNAPYDGSASYIAAYNGAAADYWLRNTPRVSFSNITWNYVGAEGTTNSHKVIYRDTIAGYRPFIVVNSGIFVTSDGTVTVNTPPVISGSDGALGSFGDTPPSYQYTVTDAQGGAVSVSERVDGTTLRTYQPSLGGQNTASIPVNTWKSLANGSHSLVITATDPAGASVTRTMTFTKNATAPAITGTDTSLGSFAETAPSYQYTVTDAQGGTVTVTETLDGAVRRTYAVTLGQTNTLTFSAEEWRKILNGTHTIRVQAVDPLGLTTVRTVTFTKNVTSLAFEQTAAMNADAMPDRCIVNIQGEFPAGSSLTVEICNNGNDASPTWEDITQNVLNGQRYFFTNQAKTAASWGVRLRASLSRGTASGPCYIASLGGNFQ